MILYQRWKLQFVWYVLLSVEELSLSNDVFTIRRYIDELLFVYLWQEILLLIWVTSCTDAKLRWRFWICVIILRILCKVWTRSHFELIIIILLLLWRLASISMKKLLWFQFMLVHLKINELWVLLLLISLVSLDLVHILNKQFWII